MPIDYGRMQDRFIIKMLRLIEELEPPSLAPVERAIALYEAKLAGEPYAFELGVLMIDAFEKYDRLVSLPDSCQPDDDYKTERNFSVWQALSYPGDCNLPYAIDNSLLERWDNLS